MCFLPERVAHCLARAGRSGSARLHVVCSPNVGQSPTYVLLGIETDVEWPTVGGPISECAGQSGSLQVAAEVHDVAPVSKELLVQVVVHELPDDA